jgi:type I restriction enzyme S subunit
VLKAAFEGRLVPQDPNDEPAKEFLNNLGIKLLDKGKSRFIPKSWELTRLENCVDILDRKRIPINSKEREKRISGKNFSNLYPYYGATGQVGWIDDYLFDEELVLLGEDGAPFLDINKDKAYIVKGKFWVNNHAHVLRAKDGLITNRFLLHYLNCFDFRDFVTGTTRLKLNQTRMKSIPIIIPPINEQNRIVEEIDRRLSIVQEIEKSFDTCLRNSQLVKNSILKSAFNGELIDQN